MPSATSTLTFPPPSSSSSSTSTSSHSLLPSTPSRPSAQRPFAYPFGPSTRFHTRERSQTQQLHFPRSYTQAVAPNLSTASRAHRRAHSAANVPLHPATKSDSRPASSTRPSRPSRHTRSVTMAAAAAPFTPAKQPPFNAILQDSPFSDYFTDEARSSPIDDDDLPFDVASAAETKLLLARLSGLQEQLSREGFTDKLTHRVIERKISELDHELASAHSQTRLPPDLDDSGLFLEEDDEHDDRAVSFYINSSNTPSKPPSRLSMPYDGADDVERTLGSSPPPSAKTDKASEAEFLMLEAQRVLDSVTKAQDLLRSHHAEIREMHSTFGNTLEEREREIETLRAENAALKADLSFDHSDLLFLKMQFRAIVVQFKGLEAEAEKAEGFEGIEGEGGDSPESRESVRLFRHGRVQAKMERWRCDAQAISDRMQRRRRVYGLPSPDLSRRDEKMEDDDCEETETSVAEAKDLGLEVKESNMPAQQAVEDVDAAILQDEPSVSNAISESDPQESGTEPESPQTTIYDAVETTDFAPADETIELPDVGEDMIEDADTLAIQNEIAEDLISIRENAAANAEANIDDDHDCAITTSSEASDDELEDDLDEAGALDQGSLRDLKDALFSRVGSPAFMHSSAASAAEKSKALVHGSKTAWQDLWEGLTNFAGLGEDIEFD